uniref:Uncharacterized protein n=1 Tax=Oryza barthii TaxID=65489 RepID=A0A0D3GM70_9ORYZ
MALRHLPGKLRLAAAAAADLQQAAGRRMVPGRPRLLSRSSQGEKNGRASRVVLNEKSEREKEILQDMERTIKRLPMITALSMVGGAGLAFGFLGCVYVIASASED